MSLCKKAITGARYYHSQTGAENNNANLVLMSVLNLRQYNDIIFAVELGALWTGRVEKVHLLNVFGL